MSPLPAGGVNEPWPPPAWGDVVRMWAEHDAWYSGDPRKLAGVYGAVEFALGQQSRVPWWRFWNRTSQSRYVLQQRTQLHVPLAGDIANTSALLLFGEKPMITIAEAHQRAEEEPEEAAERAIGIPGAPPPKPKMVTKAAPGSIEAEERLQYIIEESDLLARLYEGAETCAALGGVILKPMWDTSIADYPFINVCQADNALPEFSYGRLRAVTLWKVLPGGSNREVWRHLERHEIGLDGMGVVWHGLYKGQPGTLGDMQPLTARTETAGLEPMVQLPFPGLGVEYIPNMRPNRRFRGWYIGQSDYSGIEGLFDQLDEVWASWMRDIRLAKSRILVPQEFLTQPQGASQDQISPRFDIDQEVFSPLNLDPESAKNQAITPQQFEIRVDQHERSSNAIIERAITIAGYSPQTFGLHIEGRADSGIALRIRENKTYLTQQRKSGWWEAGVASACEKLLWIDKLLFTPGLTPFRPSVTLTDAVAPDALGTATTVEMLERARAISTYMKVKMVHPEWTEDEVQAEVTRIEESAGLAVPNPETLGIVPPSTPPPGVEQPEEGVEEVA